MGLSVRLNPSQRLKAWTLQCMKAMIRWIYLQIKKLTRFYELLLEVEPKKSVSAASQIGTLTGGTWLWLLFYKHSGGEMIVTGLANLEERAIN